MSTSFGELRQSIMMRQLGAQEARDSYRQKLQMYNARIQENLNQAASGIGGAIGGALGDRLGGCLGYANPNDQYDVKIEYLPPSSSCTVRDQLQQETDAWLASIEL